MANTNYERRRAGLSRRGWLLLGTIQLLVACEARAKTVSAEGLELTGFEVRGATSGTARVGEALEIVFVLKNVSRKPVVFSRETGVFVGARRGTSFFKRENRDFGFQHHGYALRPGQSLTYRISWRVSDLGVWTIWPAYRVGDAYGPFDTERKQLSVTEVAATLASDPRFSGPGKTLLIVDGKRIPFQMFPPDNPWNRDISKLPVHPKSDAWISNIGKGTSLHPDFGSSPRWGIPFALIRPGQKRVPVSFEYARESDAGPYPIPANAPIEGGPDGKGDRHVILLDYQQRKLYELFAAHPAGSSWKAGSGAIFDLTTNKLRPRGMTSADAAGLPILPGLTRYEEVYELGEINHALRFTAEKTQRGYIPPATHCASDVMTDLRPPMGMRVRLRADFDITPYPRAVQVILRAMKKYGMFLADNGGDWFVSGATHPGWDDSTLESLKRVKGRFFEVVDTGEKIIVPSRQD